MSKFALVKTAAVVVIFVVWLVFVVFGVSDLSASVSGLWNLASVDARLIFLGLVMVAVAAVVS